MEAIDVDKVCPREALGSSSRVSGPLTSVHAGSPAPGLATAASLDVPVKAGLAALVLQQQGSRENGSAESDGLTNDDASSAMGDPECASRSPDVLESTSFQAVSPAGPQPGGERQVQVSGRRRQRGRLREQPRRDGRSEQRFVDIYPSPADLCQSWSSWWVCGSRDRVPRYDAFASGSAPTTGQAARLHEVWEELLIGQRASEPRADSQRGEALRVQHMWARFHRQRQLDGPLLTRGANSSSARRGRKLAIENTVLC